MTNTNPVAARIARALRDSDDFFPASFFEASEDSYLFHRGAGYPPCAVFFFVPSDPAYFFAAEHSTLAFEQIPERRMVTEAANVGQGYDYRPPAVNFPWTHLVPGLILAVSRD